MKKLFFIFVVIIFSGLLGFAQKNTRSVEVGVFLGGSYYIGDLNPLFHFNQFTKPAGGFIVRYNFNQRLAARANIFIGSIQGDDSYSTVGAHKQRNLNFKSKINEASAILEFNFLDYELGNEKRRFSPYIFAGLGVFQFQPLGEFNGNWEALQPLSTEGQGLPRGASKKKYKLTQLSIPFGIGVRTHLSKNIGLSIEWGMRKTFTDYLDDVSTRYYNPAVLAEKRGFLSGALSDKSIDTDPNYTNIGRQRGNSTTKDWYSFAGIILSVKIPHKQQRCPGV